MNRTIRLIFWCTSHRLHCSVFQCTHINIIYSSTHCEVWKWNIPASWLLWNLLFQPWNTLIINTRFELDGAYCNWPNIVGFLVLSLYQTLISVLRISSTKQTCFEWQYWLSLHFMRRWCSTNYFCYCCSKKTVVSTINTLEINTRFKFRWYLLELVQYSRIWSTSTSTSVLLISSTNLIYFESQYYLPLCSMSHSWCSTNRSLEERWWIFAKKSLTMQKGDRLICSIKKNNLIKNPHHNF